MKIIAWIKNNKLSSFLLLVVLIFVVHTLIQKTSQNIVRDRMMTFNVAQGQPGMMNVAYARSGAGPTFETKSVDMAGATGMMEPAAIASTPIAMGGVAAQVTNRMVIVNTSLSLLVENVRKSVQNVQNKVSEVGGFIINSNLNDDEHNPTADISLRVPKDKVGDVMNYFKGLAVRVVMENQNRQDVTAEYTDNDARMKVLQDNKTRFQEIMNKATNVQDILQVQQEIFNLQSQIDAITGQQKYLAESSKYAYISIYMSTHEIGLPIQPGQEWSPVIIAKEAFRAMLEMLQQIGTGLIWIAVFGIIWVPLLAVIIFVVRRLKKKKV